MDARIYSGPTFLPNKFGLPDPNYWKTMVNLKNKQTLLGG